jgi:predicted nucleic acid-binding protein
MGFLLDTNVLSELRKVRPDAHVRAWISSVADTDLHISVLVIGEVRIGIEMLRLRDPGRAQVLDTWLASLERAYRGRIVPITVPVAEEWGRLNVPDRLPAIDGLQAATARVHGLTLVTRNARDVRRAGVAVLNPFEPAA